MSWLRIATVTVKLIVAAPALIELGKAGAAAGRAIVVTVKRGRRL